MCKNFSRTLVARSFRQGGGVNMRAASTERAVAGQTRSIPGALGLIIACLVAWALGANFAIAGSVTVDGEVGGFAEGYTEGYYVTFDIENGPEDVAGGQLFIEETGDALFVGMITPLTVNDNTYAVKQPGNDASNDARADDWGTIQHPLEKLERSDAWEMTIDNLVGGNKLEMKFDYVQKSLGSESWVARVEKLKFGGTDLSPSGITVHSSLDYNYNVLGMTGFFLDKNTSSSPAASDGYYNFIAPYQAWLPEIAYEFEIDKSWFYGVTDFSLTSESFRNDIYDDSIFHMSPNKLGDNKVSVNTVTVIPLPAAAWMGLSLLSGIGLVGTVRRRRR